jgi:hypothetical protein
MNRTVSAQIRYLDILKEHGLLEMALAGQLPEHVVKAAKQAVICEMEGVKTDEGKTTLHVTAEEHEEAERELDEYLKHYKLAKEVTQVLSKPMPRHFVKGAIYLVRSGYFGGRRAIYRGEDIEFFGTSWLENYFHPACEKFPFRAQIDQLDLEKGRIVVCTLADERRDVLLHENELGIRAK